MQTSTSYRQANKIKLLGKTNKDNKAKPKPKIPVIKEITPDMRNQYRQDLTLAANLRDRYQEDVDISLAEVQPHFRDRYPEEDSLADLEDRKG